MKDIINAQLKEAMKAKDELKLTTLRSMSTAMTNWEKANPGQPLDHITVIKSMVKQRNKSAEDYKNAGRTDLADRELAEVKIIETFLPEMMDDSQAETIIASIIKETGAQNTSDLGKVIKAFNEKHKGMYDNKKLSEKIRSMLA